MGDIIGRLRLIQGGLRDPALGIKLGLAVEIGLFFSASLASLEANSARAALISSSNGSGSSSAITWPAWTRSPWLTSTLATVPETAKARPDVSDASIEAEYCRLSAPAGSLTT